MDRKNLLLPAGVLLLCALLYLVGGPLAPSGGTSRVLITVDGQPYADIPLDRAETVTVRQGDAVNVVRVSEAGAEMLSSTCDNQLCVRMGAVTRENCETRPWRQYIVCLPHRVTVEVIFAP